MSDNPMTATPRPQPNTLTRWHCERCNRSGQVAHDAHEGVWQVYTQVMDAHHAATMGGCEERYYIRVEVMTADALRAEYRSLREYGVRNESDAALWMHVHSELSRLGYTLTPDETDWLPPNAARPPTAEEE